MRILTQEEFPALLNEIPDPPEILYHEGGEIPKSSIHIAIVGSRKFSDYGKRATEKIIASLQDYNVTIVSGCALGIDAIAHRAALRNNLHTIGVPGSGLDKTAFYPRSNYSLKEDILKSGGTLLSEFEPTLKAAKWTFPRRNRIMAGISHAVLVIEAAPKSGTLITARLGLEYNREVLAVPGSIFSSTSTGTNSLIRDGARPVLSAQDIIEELALEKRANTTSNTNPKNNNLSKVPLLENFPESISRDEFIARIGDAREAQILLTKLELKGVISIRGDTIFKT